MHRNYFSEARQELIQQLRKKGIADENVLNAICNIERERFISAPFQKRAYEDVALPIDKHQTISQPYTVARMTELLQIQKGDRILEIGTGSGYQAAVLSELGAEVLTIERHFELSNQAKQILKELYPQRRIHCRFGDGSIGWAEHAPYNGIIVTAGAPDVPNSLLSQLAINGRLIIPVGDEKSQVMHCIVRDTEDHYTDYPLEDFTFVPLIGKEGWSE